MPDRLPPQLVPVTPAATIILVDDRPRLSVLLLHRTSRAVFGPGAWVFPGGRLDPEDHVENFDTVTMGLSDEVASTRVGQSKGGLAWWIAACRETLEEAGLLLGSPSSTEIDTESLRTELANGDATFVDLCLRYRIKLDLSGIEHVAHFTTPLGPPRRFDTQFFIAQTPHGQSAVHDDTEIVNSAWMEPSEALARWRAGEVDMMSPTSRMLRCLEPFDSAGEVMAAAKKGIVYHKVRVVDPKNHYDVVLPGDKGYEEAALNVEFGAVRLWDPKQ